MYPCTPHVGKGTIELSAPKNASPNYGRPFYCLSFSIFIIQLNYFFLNNFRSTPNSTNSNKSLVHSLNSNTEYSEQPSRMPLSEEDRKAWSLTERVKGANGTDTNEYQVNNKFTKYIAIDNALIKNIHYSDAH